MIRSFLKSVIIFISLILFPTLLYGDEPEKGNGSVVLEQIIEESNGNVRVSIPDDILTDIFMMPKTQTKKTAAAPKYGKQSGYRIQVFSDGRNPSTLQSRAKARGSAIVAKLSKYRGQVYTFSKSPNWYTQVGNFRTTAEASAALAELKRAFPGFSGDMRIVRANVIINR